MAWNNFIYMVVIYMILQEGSVMSQENGDNDCDLDGTEGKNASTVRLPNMEDTASQNSTKGIII